MDLMDDRTFRSIERALAEIAKADDRFEHTALARTSPDGAGCDITVKGPTEARHGSVFFRRDEGDGLTLEVDISPDGELAELVTGLTGRLLAAQVRQHHWLRFFDWAVDEYDLAGEQLRGDDAFTVTASWDELERTQTLSVRSDDGWVIVTTDVARADQVDLAEALSENLEVRDGALGLLDDSLVLTGALPLDFAHVGDISRLVARVALRADELEEKWTGADEY
jgi:hypothetical protein